MKQRTEPHLTPPQSATLWAATAPTPVRAPRPRVMHLNSIAAWRSLNFIGRKAEVCGALESAGKPLTDREVCEALGKQDMNYARPAITHLVSDGVLEEIGSVECSVTRKTVRRVWFRAMERRSESEEAA